MIRSLPPSVYGVRWQGEDAQRQYAARLILTGFDVASAAVLAELPLDQVRAIAETVEDEFAPREGTAP